MKLINVQMAHYSYTVFILPFQVLFPIMVLAGDCPQDALMKIQVCTSAVLPDFSKDSLSRGSEANVHHVKEAMDSCRDSRLDDVTRCIKNILDNCKGDSKEEITLRRLVDAEKMLSTVEYFCKNLRVYELNAYCIFENHEDITACSEDAVNNFKAILKEKVPFEALMPESCKFHSVARHCLTNTTDKKCGHEAADFVYRLMTGMIPPYCSSEVFVNDSPRYTPERDNTVGGSDWNHSTSLMPSHILTVLTFTVVMLRYSGHVE